MALFQQVGAALLLDSRLKWRQVMMTWAVPSPWLGIVFVFGLLDLGALATLIIPFPHQLELNKILAFMFVPILVIEFFLFVFIFISPAIAILFGGWKFIVFLMTVFILLHVLL